MKCARCIAACSLTADALQVAEESHARHPVGAHTYTYTALSQPLAPPPSSLTRFS